MTLMICSLTITSGGALVIGRSEDVYRHEPAGRGPAHANFTKGND